jgi:hypothetical protein
VNRATPANSAGVRIFGVRSCGEREQECRIHHKPGFLFPIPAYFTSSLFHSFTWFPVPSKVFQVTIGTNSPLFGLQSGETNQLDRLLSARESAFFTKGCAKNLNMGGKMDQKNGRHG